MASRLSHAEAEKLRERLYNRIIKHPNDLQSASEWRNSGLKLFTQDQVKRQLEQLVGQGRIKAHRHTNIVYYGSLKT